MGNVLSMRHSQQEGWLGFGFGSRPGTEILVTSDRYEDLFSSGFFEALGNPNESPVGVQQPQSWKDGGSVARLARAEHAKKLLQRLFPEADIEPRGFSPLAIGKLVRPNAAEYKSLSKAEVLISIEDVGAYKDGEFTASSPGGGCVFEICFKGPLDEFIASIHERISQGVKVALESPVFMGDFGSPQVVDSFSKEWPDSLIFHEEAATQVDRLFIDSCNFLRTELDRRSNEVALNTNMHYQTKRLHSLVAKFGILLPAFCAWYSRRENFDKMALSAQKKSAFAETPFYSGVESILDYFEIRKMYGGQPIVMPCDLTRSVYESILEAQPDVLRDLCETHDCELQGVGLDFDSCDPDGITRAWVGSCVLDGIHPKISLTSIFQRKIPNLWSVGDSVREHWKDTGVYGLVDVGNDSNCIERKIDGWRLDPTISHFLTDDRFSCKRESVGFDGLYEEPNLTNSLAAIFPESRKSSKNEDIRSRATYPGFG